MKKKILVLTSTYPLNEDDPQPRFVQLLCEELTEKFDVHVLAPCVHGVTSGPPLVGKVKVARFRYGVKYLEKLCGGDGMMDNIKQRKWLYLMVPLLFMAMFFNALKYLKRQNISLIHAHWIIPQGVVAVCLKCCVHRPLKVLITSHGGDLYALNSKLFALLKRFVLRYADHITVVSSAMRDFCIEEFEVPANRLSVRSMGVSLEAGFVPGEKKIANRLVFVGRLVEKKGVDVLLNALSQLKNKAADFHVDIIGGGANLASLSSLAESLSISNNVSFHGALPNAEIVPYLQQASIAVFPFRQAKNGDQEGLGLTVVEAMGCECLVIVSRLPATEDVVFDGVNGLLVEPESPNELALAISNSLSANSSFAPLPLKAREMALSKYDWSIVGNDYKSIIAKL